jgi:hypothetical protein
MSCPAHAPEELAMQEPHSQSDGEDALATVWNGQQLRVADRVGSERAHQHPNAWQAAPTVMLACSQLGQVVAGHSARTRRGLGAMAMTVAAAQAHQAQCLRELLRTGHARGVRWIVALRPWASTPVTMSCCRPDRNIGSMRTVLGPRHQENDPLL